MKRREFLSRVTGCLAGFAGSVWPLAKNNNDLVDYVKNGPETSFMKEVGITNSDICKRNINIEKITLLDIKGSKYICMDNETVVTYPVISFNEKISCLKDKEHIKNVIAGTILDSPEITNIYAYSLSEHFSNKVGYISSHQPLQLLGV